MESCQTGGHGKLLCLCLRRDGLGVSAEQLIPACNLYHPCCCYCLCGIRGRLKECQRVPAGPSTVAVTSALSASRRSRISLAFCLSPILIPAPPNLYQTLLDNQEATEECTGGNGEESRREQSLCAPSRRRRKKWSPGWNPTLGAEKVPCPLTTSSHSALPWSSQGSYNITDGPHPFPLTRLSSFHATTAALAFLVGSKDIPGQWVTQLGFA